MTDATTCPRCGAPLASGGSPADCPRCLLAAGLETGAAGADAGGSTPPAPTAPSPEEIGRYFPQLEVLELLGQGGMGIVYKARQRSLDRMVALKVMPPEASREPGFAERFTREARTLARLQHANIVGVHDFGVADGLYFLLMEYVDGLNLRQAMREGKLTAHEALAIVPQICDALQYAHEQGVVHRDVKPENILIDRAGRVRIADFGLAKIVQRTPVDVTLTRAGQVMGTLHYMAPEQYRTPDSVDHRADIYSLGVVFYEMLTGELPLGSFPPPSSRAGVDARLDGVVLRALESERDRRWQSASDVKTQVSAIADDEARGPAVGAGAAAATGAAAVAGAAAAAGGAAAPGERTVTFTADEQGARVELRGMNVKADESGVRIDLGGKSVGPDGRPLPVSRAAVLGGLGVPGGIALGLLVWGALRLAGRDDIAVLAGFGACSAALLAGWIASIVAWTRIHQSRGQLSGTGWAVVGTFLPAAFLCCGGLVAPVLLGSYWNMSVQDGPDGTHVRMPFLDVEESGGRTRVRMPGIDITSVEEISEGTVRIDARKVTPTEEDRTWADRIADATEKTTPHERATILAVV